MAISQINTGTGINLASGATLATAATALTAGNFIAVLVQGGNVTFSVTDTAGNTYTSVMSQLTAGGTKLELFYANNVTGNASNVVTANYSPSTTSRVIGTAQYSGLTTTNALIVVDGDVVVATASIALTSKFYPRNALLIAACCTEATGGTWTPGTGLTSVVQDSSTVTIMAENITSGTPATVTPSMTSTSATRKALIAAVFTATPAGASGPGTAYAFAG